MSNNMKDMYKGFNPIYENLVNSVNEDKEKGSSKKIKALDTISAVSTALNTFFSILMSSKMENAKTPRGFQEIKNKMLGTNNFGAFRQYLISVVQSLAAMDLTQKEAYQRNIQFLMDILGGDVETLLSDTKLFDSLKKDTISKLLVNFENDLKDRETQLRKTNPKLFGDVVKQGLIVKEGKRTGDESDPEEAEFRGQAFNKSKESLDAANAFVGMIDRDKYIAVLKDNGDVKRYKEIADGLYKKAQDLQMIDRSGALKGKIVTPSGEFKGREYKRKQDDLINEIIRQKSEYQRVKDGILKQGGLTPPPPIPVVCPPGKKFDSAKGICVDAGGNTGGGTGTTPKPTPTPVSECKFPIKLGTKCKDVATLQNKMMEILPSVKEYLPTVGGADKKYGKGTAKVTNIIWSYLTGNSLNLTGDLTKDMYDRILALTANDVDLKCYNPTQVTDSLDWEMSIEDKIEEREQIKNAPVLSFEDFYSVIEESYSFAKLDEQVFDRLKKAVPTPTPTPTPTSTAALIDCCVKDSISQEALANCAGATGGETGTGTTGGETGATGDIKWKGLKPVNDGAYTLYYDESWADWWGDVGKGALVAGLIVGAVVLTAGAAGAPIAVGGASLGTASAGAAAGSAAVPIATAGWGLGTGVAGAAGALGAGASLGTAAGAITLATGAIGGSAIAKWAGSDRKPVTVLVFNGYIESVAVKAMARGLYNSLGGTVSSQDLLAIYSTLILCRGTYTEGAEGKAVSVWQKVKSDYAAFGGGDVGSEIRGITSGGAGGFFKDIVTDMDELPGFPLSFKTKDPTNSGGPTTFESAKDACDEAVAKLDGNATKMSENLTHITEEDLEMLSEGMGEITSGVRDQASEESEE